MIEYTIVGIVVAAAFAYVVKYLRDTMRGKTACHCDNTDCSKH